MSQHHLHFIHISHFQIPNHPHRPQRSLFISMYTASPPILVPPFRNIHLPLQQSTIMTCIPRKINPPISRNATKEIDMPLKMARRINHEKTRITKIVNRSREMQQRLPSRLRQPFHQRGQARNASVRLSRSRDPHHVAVIPTSRSRRRKRSRVLSCI
ncbi:hypothetical protein K402DRAFT_187526 [Aulographum hederae CBS 113979]|uniref:Uncharacterized protein n=1 Tax=Aulographum hederae CBS 113979 TaxID=1176131 RepID=A0A6G1GQ31_9PEZI|nr:hypothetical protein K402DRAFT_187526 [Aulographum hederae CBS 113979]